MTPFEHSLRTIIDTIPVLAWTARPDGSIDFFNQQWVEYTGMSVEEAVDWGWKVAKHPDDLPHIFDVFENAARSGQSFEVEGRVRRRDGVFRWFLIRGNPLRDASGNIVKWYGTDVDIEDRKKMEEVTRANEQNLRMIIDHIPGSVFTANATGELEVINHQAAVYTGTTAEEIKSWRTNGTLHPDDRPRLKESWDNAMRTGQPVDLEVRSRAADGVYRWLHLRNRPQCDADGRVVRWYNLVTDIDTRKKAETELAKAFEEIQKLKDRLQDENFVLKEQIDRAFMFDEIVGSSPALRAVLSKIVKVAPTDATVLLTGETGTGKELVARAIHEGSQRKNQAFVSVNCAAIPSSLIESELFGHEKGAFTGATQRRRGRFELAQGGTIFLDEVGELLPDTQTALLRVLQEREVERVGGSQPIKVDVRVIAATNRDLAADVAAGIFRTDLFYRLNVLPIELPPLRERREDIELLVKHFAERYARKVGKKVPEIDDKSMDLLQKYSWPGNVRELQNLIERALILHEPGAVFIQPSWLSGPWIHSTANSPSNGLKKSAHEEKVLIQTALQESGGQVSGPRGAAVRLGIPRSTLESKIRALRIDKHLYASGTSASR